MAKIYVRCGVWKKKLKLWLSCESQKKKEWLRCEVRKTKNSNCG